MVDRYWVQLEYDFRVEYGLRALDWVAGKYDWREFYRLKQGLGQGTRFFSAVANDPMVAEELLAKPKEKRENTGPVAPPAEGWFPWKDDLADIKDSLTAVRGALTGAQAHQMHWTPRPIYLVEKMRSEAGRKKARKMTAQLLPDQNIQIED